MKCVRRFAAGAGCTLLGVAAAASAAQASAEAPPAQPSNGWVAAQGSASASAAAPWDDPSADVYQMAKNLFDENVPPEIKAEYEFPDRAQFLEFAARLQAALDGDSLANLAAFAPEARTVLAALRLSPEAADYADWLEARLQEIETAAQIEERVHPARPPPRVTGSTAAPLPSPQPATSPSGAPPSVSHPALVPSPAPPRLSSLPFPQSSARSALAPPSARGSNIPYFNVWLSRVRDHPAPVNAAQLMPRLRADFASEGVSPDLAWLAEVESSLHPRASNPSGARGLFQLKAATAKDLGLSTFLPDQRTDPDKSARAAARYLRSLELRFGSWPLALAAYNAGEGRVARALSARHASNFAEIASALPAGTQMYVPEVCALIETRTGTPPDRLPLPRA